MKDKIEHSGTIVSIVGNDVKVRILQAAACSGCKAKSMCTSSEQKEKFVDVNVSFPERYAVGEEVLVCSTLTAGKVAVWLAFGGPLVIICLWAFVGTLVLHLHELLTCGIMFLLLAIYFVVMHQVEKRYLKKVLTFWIEKYNN